MKNPINIHRGTFALSLIAMAIVIVGLSASTVISQEPGRKYDVAGRWQGKFPREEGSVATDADTPVAVEIDVKNDAGKVSGTITFFVIRNNGDKQEVKGRVDLELVDPKFDGTALTFNIKSKTPQVDKATQTQMRMKLTSPLEAELENLDDSSAPLFKMKKVP